MTERTIGRRALLRGAGVAAGGLAASGMAMASPAAAGDNANAGGGLTGSWLVTRQDEGDPTRVQVVISFAAGNVLITHDISPAGPPLTGTWERREGKRFRATVWSGFPGEEGPGSLGPTIRVRIRGRRERGVISGTYTVTVFAPGSDEVLFEGPGTFRGRRIEA